MSSAQSALKILRSVTIAKRNSRSRGYQSYNSNDSGQFYSFPAQLESANQEVKEDPEEDKSDSSDEETRFPALNYDQIDAEDMKIVAEGAHMMFINDHKGVFYPVLSLALAEVEYKNSSLFNNTYA